MAKFQIGSYQHKKLFCELLTEPSSLSDLSFPALEELTQKRLAELSLWPALYEQLQRSGALAQSVSQTAQGGLLQRAIARLAEDDLAIATAIKTLCQDNHLTDANFAEMSDSSSVTSDFETLCHQNNMGLFWLSGLYELASQEDYLQTDVLTVFEQILTVQARHSLFFINWLMFESQVKQKPEYELVGLRSFWSLKDMWLSIFTKLDRSEYDDNLPIHPDESDYFLGKWGYSDFIQACESSYLERLKGYDDRLVQPQLLLKVAKFVQTLLGFWPQRTKATKAPLTSKS